MRRLTVFVLVLAGLAACASAVWLFLLFREGARHRPSDLETSIARGFRQWAIPRSAREARNPVPATDETLREGREHFADHCAICHANDGSGDTEIGRGLYPPAPDMRKEATQSLSDGELFFVIHYGIPLTGMPAWGEGDPGEDRDSWELVHFIRRLPEITPAEIAEMETMNPKSSAHREEDEEAERFLRGESDGKPAHGHGHHH